MQIRSASDDDFLDLLALRNHALEYLTAEQTGTFEERSFRLVASGLDQGWVLVGLDPGALILNTYGHESN